MIDLNGIKIISIRQPWAWLIVNGYKDIENRTWETSYRGPVLIHAGTQLDPDYVRNTQNMRNALAFLMEHSMSTPRCQLLHANGEPWPALPETFDMGGIVGLAEITYCTRVSVSHWFTGPWGFELGEVRTLPFIPCKGQLGLWTPPSPVLEAVSRYLTAAG